MRAVIQRVLQATVTVEAQAVGDIGQGLLILLGVSKVDTEADALFLIDKIWNLRIFNDEQGKMNLSALAIGAEILVVSQFTIYGDTRKGRRPGFDAAASPELAERLYRFFVEEGRKFGLRVEEGRFRAHMKVSLINDGPVTFICESYRDKKNSVSFA